MTVHITMLFIHFFYFVNLLFRKAMSFVGGGGTWAVVGAISAGSLLLRSTILLTLSRSLSLLLNMREINTGMYSYPFSHITFLISHCLVLGLYFLVTMPSPEFDFFWGRWRWKFQSMAVSCRLALYAGYLKKLMLYKKVKKSVTLTLNAKDGEAKLHMMWLISNGRLEMQIIGRGARPLQKLT